MKQFTLTIFSLFTLILYADEFKRNDLDLNSLESI